MKKQLAVVRNLCAASAFALVGLGLTPSHSAAAVNAANKGMVWCTNVGECVYCTDGAWMGCELWACGDVVMVACYGG
ncbi:MAG: hypothetical protein JWM41_370 [Gemmatimonadetes bacterium]|nr:hypothetical protein [Gemmatimonadota bacterium]